jgi:GNAT superfamily N-acetyltransferase
VNDGIVTAAKRHDARSIARVQVGSWRETYRGLIAQRLLDALDEDRISIRWSQIIGSGEQVVLVARLPEGEIVGFAGAGLPSESIAGFDCELHKLYVLRRCQGLGIGRNLLQTAASRLYASGYRALMSHVLATTPGCTFYERFGAERLQVTPIPIEGDSYTDVAYGWRDMAALLSPPG